jgi:hypothetical protein
VINKINEPAAIYRNAARELNGRHYLRVALRGADRNTSGIGSKVTVWQGNSAQLVEQMPTRGFQSSVDPRLHFGLGGSARVDSLRVVWPDKRCQLLRNVTADVTLTLVQADAKDRCDPRPSPAMPPIFTDVTSSLGIKWRHRENDVLDFDREPLIPHALSTEGPAIAVGDVNGDGLEDLYVGGAKWQAGTLFLQQRDGTFRESPQSAFRADSLFEDVDAVFFDANGDGYPDLYVVSGGGEFTGTDDALQDRLYLNDGHGNFHRAAGALPRMAESGSRVVPGDFNGDGKIDLFVGRRAVTGAYGASPKSYLLENDGTGHFRDVTSERAPMLASAGMITSAAWVDYDHDGRLDLVVAGEWTPVHVLHQENGRFVDRTREVGLAGTNGWWNDIVVADLNGDGRPDLILGNLGLNSMLTASRDRPARLYVGRFAHDRSTQPLLTTYRSGVSYPVAQRDELAQAIPALRARYSSYADFGASRVEDIVSHSDIAQAKTLEAYDFATSVAINNGNGTFTIKPLGAEAQFAPVRAIVAADFDEDGRTDLLLAGNDLGMPPAFGPHDASYGVLLRGKPDGGFESVDLAVSGLVLDGQVRHIGTIRQAGGARLVVVARNDETLQVLRIAGFRP